MNPVEGLLIFICAGLTLAVVAAHLRANRLEDLVDELVRAYAERQPDEDDDGISEKGDDPCN